MPRLLICKPCRTIETLPLFEGPSAEEAQDPLLDGLVRRHVQKHGDIQSDAGLLMRVKDTDWDKHRFEILNNLKQRWTGFEPSLYAIKSTYEEDAMACFRRHGRPTADCYDWRDDSKLLTPTSWHRESDDIDRSEQKKILAEIAPARQPVYLCDFCPVAIYYTTRLRMAAGAYDKQPGEDQ